ncbi:hypothetical protein KY284_032750 [Solanum tuberosum]|nr:hypothetical protein KY284_032750 [Solanum tuberosum]
MHSCKKFFQPLKKLQLKDEIGGHKQLPAEDLHDSWLKFSQKLKQCPKHKLIDEHLMEIFNRSYNFETKLVVDAVCEGSFMEKTFAEATSILDKMSKNSGA